jgi:hypothetical protein
MAGGVHNSESIRRASLGTAFIALLVSVLATRTVFAAGIPLPPPPQPPCIATAGLDNPEVFDPHAGYWCMVVNVGATTHNVAISIKDPTNLQDLGFSTATLTPGAETSSLTGGFTPMACEVTTDEGTTDALGDLAVVFQMEVDGLRVGETKGKIVQQCQPTKF